MSEIHEVTSISSSSSGGGGSSSSLTHVDTHAAVSASFQSSAHSTSPTARLLPSDYTELQFNLKNM
jgi:hypothetical protein